MITFINLNNQKTNQFFKLCCQFRNKVQTEIKFAKSDIFFSNTIEVNKNSPRKLWQQLKDLGYKNRKNNSSNFVLTIDDQVFCIQYNVPFKIFHS